MIYVGNKKYSLYVENKRREMIIPESLPYDAEIEYLESTGTQYIDTGLVHQVQNYEYYIDFTPKANENSTAVFGSSNNGYWDGISWGGNLYIGRQGLGGRDFSRVVNIRQTTRMVVVDNHVTVYKDGNITSDFDFEGSIISGRHILLYAYTYNSDDASGKSLQKVHSFSLIMNGVKVLDYIPVRVGQTGYMYDKVSGQLFGNSGTGDFVLGPDKSPSILPSGYTQILGVKNTSTAYLPAPTINAGVRYELEIAGHAGSTNISVFGNNGSSNKEILVFFRNTTTCYLGGIFQVANFTQDQKYKIVIDLAMESEYARMYIDDVLVRQTSLNIDTGRDMQIFRDGSRGGAVYGTMYSFKGYINNVLVNNYIPAIRNSDGKVGVYDIASNEFVLSPNDVDFEAVLQ